MGKDLELLKKKLEREQASREEAEKLLEQKSLELYNSNEKLKELNVRLEKLVEKRTQKLQETELEYQTMVESINDMIFRLDIKGNITFTNQIASRIMGSKGSDLIGRHILDFVLEEERQTIFRHFARKFLSRTCINYYDVLVQTNSGNTIWLRLNVQFSGDDCKECLKKQQSMAGIIKDVQAVNDCKFNEIFIVAHDVTQRKLALDKLEKSEKRYKELTESLPEIIWEIDTEGNIKYVNQYAIEKFGYTSQELLSGSFSFLNFFPEDSKENARSRLNNILLTGEGNSGEYMVIPKNGELLSVIINTTPIHEQGDIIGVRGIMFDITIRKKQELEIALNLKQQKLLSDISMRYNTSGNFEENTNQALRLIGEHLDVSRVYVFEDSESGESTSNTFEWCNEGIKAQQDSLQDIPYSIIPSWHKFLLEDKIVFSTNIGEMPKDIVDILEPQGIKSILVLPLIEHKKQIGFIGFDQCAAKHIWRESEIELLRTISNIISHNYIGQRVQNELINSEKENRILIESIPDVIIHADSWGEIKALKASENSKLSNLIKSRNSQTIFSAFNEKLSGFLHNAINECLEENIAQVEFKNLNWDEVEHYEARLVKLNSNEVLIIVRDVTVLKQNAEQLVVAKNKAEEASRMKSEFLANVSHEIRTPMNAILGFSQWLLDNTSETLHKSYLKNILKSGRGLLNVINDILDIAKLESNALNIDLHVMSYKDVMADIKTVFTKDALEKGLSFKITTEDSVPPFIVMDEIRFYQIIFNLVNNAIKFTEKGYVQVTAYAGATEVSDEVNLIINVEDTGIGISKEMQSKIFDSFTQQNSTKDRNYEGTGLGLAIVNGLLNKLNGEIKVKSEPGKGSTFTLSFYKVKVGQGFEKPKQTVENDVSVKLKPCSVMIVDDIDDNIEVLKTMINSKEVRYLEAKDGNTALSVLQVNRPDIIFMDIRMPGPDGFEITKLIKADELLGDIPVIAFSASTIKSRKELIEEWFDDYLIKPVVKEDLEKILLEHIPQFVDTISENQSTDIEVEDVDIIEKPKNLEFIIDVLDNDFQLKWENIKDNLVIYEIEAFKNELSIFAQKESCQPLIHYCKELEMGLNMFDIDQIGKKVKEFQFVSDKLKQQRG